MADQTYEQLLKRIDDVAKSTSGTFNLLRKERDDKRPKARLAYDWAVTIPKSMDKAVTGTVKSLQAFSSSINGVNSGLIKLGAAFGVGGIVSSLIQTFNDASSTYRRMADIGQTFNGSIIDMRQSAAASGKTLSEFAHLIGNGHNGVSQTVAALGGARGFGSLLQRVRQSTEAAGMFAYSIEGLDEFASEYLNTMRLYGQIQKNNDTQHSRAIVELAQTTTGYAALFGKNRREIMQDANRSARTASLLARNVNSFTRLSDVQQSVFNRANAFLAALPGETGQELSQYLSEAVGSGSVQFSDLFQTFSRAGVSGVNIAMNQFRTAVELGGLSAEQQAELNNRMVDEYERAAPMLRMRAAFDNDAKRAVQLLSNLRRVTAAEIKQRENDAKYQESLTKVTLFFTNMYKRVVGRFIEGLMNPLLEIEKSFSDARFSTSVENFMNTMETFGTRVGRWIQDTFTPDRVRQWTSQIMMWMSSIATTVRDWVGRFMAWINNPDTEKSLMATWESVTTRMSDIGKKMGYVLDKVFNVVKWISEHPLLATAIAGGAVGGGALAAGGAAAAAGLAARKAMSMAGRVARAGLGKSATATAGSVAGMQAAGTAAAAAGARSVANTALRRALGPAALILGTWDGFDNWSALHARYQKGEIDTRTYQDEFGKLAVRHSLKAFLSTAGALAGGSMGGPLGAVAGGVGGYFASDLIPQETLSRYFTDLALSRAGGRASPEMNDQVREQEERAQRLTLYRDVLQRRIMTSPMRTREQEEAILRDNEERDRVVGELREVTKTLRELRAQQAEQMARDLENVRQQRERDNAALRAQERQQ